ncbi:MAG: barnase inhibitor [Chloroflexi bacterium]|nr:barnase inhibitor [Chloroflexota bacterium]
MSRIQSALTGERPPGVYRFNSRLAPATVQHIVEPAGWRCFRLDGREISDKASFLRACATAMGFPGYFGHNWDAFEESLRDLSWAPAPGYVVLFDHAGQFATVAPGEWATALAIFQDSVAAWGQTGVPLYVLLRGRGIKAPEM